VNWARRLVLALQFLTVATVWPRLRARPGDLPASASFFPLIGLILGLALAAARWLMAFWPPLLADALVVVLMVLLTRGLHLEGLADAADGLLGRLEPDKALEVMKDSRSGAFAVMAVAMVLLVKWAALMALPPGLKLQALVLAPLAGRWAMVAVAYRSPAARREGGLGREFLEGLSGWFVLAAFLSALVAAVLILGRLGGFIILGAAVWAWLARFYLLRRLGGLNGDLIGATGELAEVGALLSLAGLAV